MTANRTPYFCIGDNGVFLDPETKTMLAVGNPKTLRNISPEPKIQAFLRRGEADVPPRGDAGARAPWLGRVSRTMYHGQ